MKQVYFHAGLRVRQNFPSHLGKQRDQNKHMTHHFPTSPRPQVLQVIVSFYLNTSIHVYQRNLDLGRDIVFFKTSCLLSGSNRLHISQIFGRMADFSPLDVAKFPGGLGQRSPLKDNDARSM